MLPKDKKAAPTQEAPKKASSKRSSSEKSSKKSSSKTSPPSKHLLIVAIVFIAVAAWFFLGAPSPQKKAGQNQDSVMNKKLNTYLQDGQKKKELNEMGVEVENRSLANSEEELPAFLPLDAEDPQRRPMGVELEQDPAMENVYRDLYGESTGPGVSTPEERINARLSDKKWIHKYEKEEKKTFIRNFIAAAREAGYEIELNDDLIVTRVKVITNRPKMPLDKVIEKVTNSN